MIFALAQVEHKPASIGWPCTLRRSNGSRFPGAAAAWRVSRKRFGFVRAAQSLAVQSPRGGCLVAVAIYFIVQQEFDVRASNGYGFNIAFDGCTLVRGEGNLGLSRTGITKAENQRKVAAAFVIGGPRSLVGAR
jgi:hypothetical protein